MSSQNKDSPEKPAPSSYRTDAGDEIRGDQILVSARKFNKQRLVRRSGQHNASEMVIEKDARAKLLKGYTSTASRKSDEPDKLLPGQKDSTKSRSSP